MKKLKFTTKTAIALSTLLVAVIFLCGCNDGTMPNSKSEWVIEKVEHENKVMATYYCSTLDKTALNTSNTWFMDSIGKFEIGDTVCWAKK